MLRYLRFGWVLLFSAPLAFGGLLMGGPWTWIGIAAPMAVMLSGDWLLGDDLAAPALKWPRLLNTFLFAQVPVTFVAIVLIAWKAAPGDLFGIGALAQHATGWDVATGHHAGAGSLTGGLLAISLLLSVNFFIGHELVHRADALSVFAARWLFAAVGDTQFSISHLYDHHIHVGTPRDPATARRGESLYGFMLRSSIGQWLSSARIEADRLRRTGKPAWSMRNRFLRGQVMTLAIAAALLVACGGWQGMLAWAFCAFYAKVLYEAVNYIQHYGLVRAPGTPVEPRHSWDCTAPLSSAFLVNLTRHADHHARGDVPFWSLHSQPLAPHMPRGYFASIFIAFVPPLWHREMAPLLERWDAKFASAEETTLLRAATARRDGPSTHKGKRAAERVS